MFAKGIISLWCLCLRITFVILENPKMFVQTILFTLFMCTRWFWYILFLLCSFQCAYTICFLMVGLSGLELLTSRLSGVRSNQLSYRPIMVETRRIELLTPCLQGRCSPSWATPPLWYVYFPLSLPLWGRWQSVGLTDEVCERLFSQN